MPAAVLAGGGSRRMGREKGGLPYGAGSLAEFQTSRLQGIFEDVWLVAKRPPNFAIGPARLLLDGTDELAAIYGLRRALSEARDRVFVLAVDLPVITEGVIRSVASRGALSEAPVVLARAQGRLQPLAAVWRHGALPELERRLAAGDLSVLDLAEFLGAETLAEEEWRTFDPSGNSFLNMNTLEEYRQLSERA